MALTNQAILSALYAIAPQFANPDPDTLAVYNQLIDLLRCEFNEAAFCTCGALAFAYLLAHTLTLRSNPLTGVANSLHEGDLSISLAIQAGGSVLDATSYGKAYKDMIKRLVVGPTVTNLPPNFSVVGYGSCGCGC